MNVFDLDEIKRADKSTARQIIKDLLDRKTDDAKKFMDEFYGKNLLAARQRAEVWHVLHEKAAVPDEPPVKSKEQLESEEAHRASARASIRELKFSPEFQRAFWDGNHPAHAEALRINRRLFEEAHGDAKDETVFGADTPPQNDEAA